MVRSFHARLRNLVFILGGKEIDSTPNLAQGEEGRVHHKLPADHLDNDLGQGSTQPLWVLVSSSVKNRDTHFLERPMRGLNQ